VLKNPKHQKIVDMKAEGKTSAEIADVVGLHKDWVRAVLTKPHVKAELALRTDDIRQETRRKYNIDREKLIEMFLAVHDKSMQKRPVLGKDGKPRLWRT
jgi:hypothetical protein